ncbi:cysteine--tRNA ligase [Candidatus Pacearchaeota archaeon]|nr:cysteine--tRNA ligase [Candidatus Pacearchaeota archaeon]
MDIYLYNTLTRKKEVFKPIKKGHVGIYSCGPTLYWYQHVGNFRTTLLSDFLKRILKYNGYKIKHAMNFTDVDDKTIRASQKEKVTLKNLTKKYEGIFLKDIDNLNIIRPNEFLRATDNIGEMVKIIQKLLKKGYAYTASDGVYFSISKSKRYGSIAGLDNIKVVKERINRDEYDKSNASDFVLWKFYSKEDGDVFWETPIGKGRPGWHIECSAMSIGYLGPHFDLHVGGMDLIFPHHANEIAQSEAFSGKKFVNYWIHGGLLNLKTGKMSKSEGNIYTLEDLSKEGFNPVYYRYLCLQTNYRKPLEFSFDSLEAAKNAYDKIKRKIIRLRKERNPGNTDIKYYKKQFLDAINDDLNMSKALEVFWEVMEETDMNSKTRLQILEDFDMVLGLGLRDMKEKKIVIPKDVTDLLTARQKARKEKNFPEADILRARIKERGFIIEDLAEGGPSLRPI